MNNNLNSDNMTNPLGEKSLGITKSDVIKQRKKNLVADAWEYKETSIEHQLVFSKEGMDKYIKAHPEKFTLGGTL